MPEDTDDSSTPKSDPSAFNLRKWIDRGAMRPVKYVEVYLAAGLEAEIRELDAQMSRAQGGVQDDRLGVASPLPDMARRRDALAAEMESSRVAFKFRGLKPGEVDDVRAEAGTPADGDQTDLTMRLLARQCLQPAGLTHEDFAALHEQMGDEYFGNTLLRAAGAASGGTAIDVPFSLLSSEILRTQASSGS